MRVVRIQTQGFKKVVMVDHTPDPETNVIQVRGDNAEGKSSLIDSIMAALGGAEASPIKPIRTGEEYAAIRVTLGDDGPDLIVTKYYDEAGEKLKVTNAEGAEWKAGQTKVDNLLGRMTFDPLAFSRLPADKQAVELRRLVPLAVDLDALAAEDKADTAARRDVNRDARALKARLDVIPVETDLPEDKPDLNALTSTLASAADVNTAIERERDRRAAVLQNAVALDTEAERWRSDATAQRAEAARLIERAERAEALALDKDAEAVGVRRDLDALPPLDEPVDTSAARAAIDAARATLDRFARKEARDRLSADFEALRLRSEGFTAKMEARAKVRSDALASAVMPVPGLSLARLCDVVPGEESEELIVVYEGEPFAQASGAQQLRVSMRLAMAANPKLRVMLIKDGSLLDTKGLALVKEMAGSENYQVWLESVGEGDGTGLIMEAGTVRGAPEPERLDPPKRRRKADPAERTGEIASGDGYVPLGVVQLPAGDTAIEAGQAVKINDAGKVEPAAPPPARRKPSAMREFSTPTPKPGGLFGDDE
jgi:hypothetical protein